jgi:hypothetical protein
MEKLDVLDRLIERANKVMGKEKSATLTTKQRKKLKDSQFCLPGSRAFPVPDCSHYTAALRLLNRSKFSEGTKAKIHACVIKKGKALGCTKKEKSFLTEEDISGIIELEIFKETRELVEQSIQNPDMELDFAGCKKCV